LAPAFTHSAGLGGVREDAVQPRPQRRTPFELRKTLEDPQPRVLHDLFGDGLRRHVHPRDPKHHGLMLFDEHHERVLVAGSKTFHES
jgi:hypothetical protein